jgi:hypothetical protein
MKMEVESALRRTEKGRYLVEACKSDPELAEALALFSAEDITRNKVNARPPPDTCIVSPRISPRKKPRRPHHQRILWREFFTASALSSQASLESRPLKRRVVSLRSVKWSCRVASLCPRENRVKPSRVVLPFWT